MSNFIIQYQYPPRLPDEKRPDFHSISFMSASGLLYIIHNREDNIFWILSFFSSNFFLQSFPGRIIILPISFPSKTDKIQLQSLPSNLFTLILRTPSLFPVWAAWITADTDTLPFKTVMVPLWPTQILNTASSDLKESDNVYKGI